MKIKEAVGIDVGKLTNEARVHTTGACRAFSNSQEGYRQLLRWAHQSASCAPARADMLSVRCKPLQAQQSWHYAVM